MKVLENTLFHTAIIGGGAAGLFCAGSFSAPKIVLEAGEKLARKVSVSGGGKCNFSNRFVSAQDYDCQQPHFCKSALAAFKPTDFLNLLDQARIPWQERTQGRLFAQNAQDIAAFLLRRARQQNTQLACGVTVLEVQQHPSFFTLHTSAGSVQAKQVVLACGGLSYPALGATCLGWQLARKLGLNTVAPAPALCGLLLPKEQRARFAPLAGNSLPVRVRCAKHCFEDQLLFTHDGVSGPAILQISLFYQPGQAVEINFLPQQDVREIFSQNKTKNQRCSAVLKKFFPGKIAPVLLQGADGTLANASRMTLTQAARQIHQFSFVPAGTFGYTKAEVTRGGIDTRQLDARTMQVRGNEGLYAIGELVDVTGRLGGFNLQWAWSSAFAAASDLAHKF